MPRRVVSGLHLFKIMNAGPHGGHFHTNSQSQGPMSASGFLDRMRREEEARNQLSRTERRGSSQVHWFPSWKRGTILNLMEGTERAFHLVHSCWVIHRCSCPIIRLKSLQPNCQSRVEFLIQAETSVQAPGLLEKAWPIPTGRNHWHS